MEDVINETCHFCGGLKAVVQMKSSILKPPKRLSAWKVQQFLSQYFMVVATPSQAFNKKGGSLGFYLYDGSLHMCLLPGTVPVVIHALFILPDALTLAPHISGCVCDGFFVCACRCVSYCWSAADSCCRERTCDPISSLLLSSPLLLIDMYACMCLCPCVYICLKWNRFGWQLSVCLT